MNHAGYDVVHVATCDCVPAVKRLVRSGYFPSTVAEPSIAFSFDLLDFFKRLYEESSDATAAMAGALVNFLGDKGFTFVNSQVFKMCFIMICILFNACARDFRSTNPFGAASVAQYNGTTS